MCMSDKKTPISVKIIPERKNNTSRIFSNYVRAVATPIDVTLQFSDAKPPINEDEQNDIEKNKIVKATIEAEIVLPKAVAIELANILSKQFKNEINSK